MSAVHLYPQISFYMSIEDLPEFSLSKKTDSAALSSHQLSMVPFLDTEFVPNCSMNTILIRVLIATSHLKELIHLTWNPELFTNWTKIWIIAIFFCQLNLKVSLLFIKFVLRAKYLTNKNLHRVYAYTGGSDSRLLRKVCFATSGLATVSNSYYKILSAKMLRINTMS